MDVKNELLSLPEVCFVTGIGTDVGKTYATGWLASLIMKSGRSVITQKFVQTGNTDASEDIARHRELMGIGMLPEDNEHITAPVIFSYPASPDLAARLDHKEFDLAVPARATATLASRYDHVLVEGAGGLMVPLKGEYLAFDYIKDNSLPVIVVTNGQLGSINHTLLTLELLLRDGVRIVAVVYNPYFDRDHVICGDTKEYVSRWLAVHSPSTRFVEMPVMKMQS